jgi:hypothetical protein
VSRRLQVEPLVRALLDGVHDSAGDPDRRGAERARVDLGVVPVFSDERPLLGLAGLIDWRGSGCLSAVLRSGFCSASLREQLLVPCDRRLPVDRLVLVGLGPRDQYDEPRARALAEQSVRVAIGLAAPTVLIALPTHGMDRTLTEVAFASLVATIDEHETEEGGDDEVSDPEPVDTAPASHDLVRWWVAADEAVVARLRRVLSGPPRATRGGAGLHT